MYMTKVFYGIDLRWKCLILLIHKDRKIASTRTRRGKFALGPSNEFTRRRLWVYPTAAIQCDEKVRNG
jgi:hypothetical protein